MNNTKRMVLTLGIIWLVALVGLIVFKTYRLQGRDILVNKGSRDFLSQNRDAEGRRLQDNEDQRRIANSSQRSTIQSATENQEEFIGEKLGMTWGKADHNDQFGIDLLSCYGKPKPEGKDACNAYIGDTPCSRALPILCVRKDRSPRPGYEINSPDHAWVKESYRGWLEGSARTTSPIVGNAIKNLNDANRICEEQFGLGYQMAEFHDGKWVRGMSSVQFHDHSWPENTNEGGWSFWAYGDINYDSRFWVYIRDQQANCWSEDRNRQIELYRQQLEKGRESGWISQENENQEQTNDLELRQP